MTLTAPRLTRCNNRRVKPIQHMITERPSNLVKNLLLTHRIRQNFRKIELRLLLTAGEGVYDCDIVGFVRGDIKGLLSVLITRLNTVLF